MLSSIKFLKFKNLIHNNIICSSVLLNNDNEIKISMQKHCTVMSKEIKREHLNIQTVEDFMMQLLKKCKRGKANDLCHWSSMTEEFLLKIMSAFTEELLQVSKFDPLQMMIILTLEACLSSWLKEEWPQLVDVNHSSLITQILYDEVVSCNVSAFSMVYWPFMQLHTLYSILNLLDHFT